MTNMNPESPYTQPGAEQPYYQPVQQPQPAPQPGYAPIQPVPLPPIKRRRVNVWFILTFVFIFTTLAMGGVSIWALINYFDQKDNTDSKITSAVGVAVKKQQDTDAANFLQQEKQPNRSFAGPDDYGRLAFDYPKTWSIYVAKDATNGGDYEAYFNPVSVPPVSQSQIYALHVLIQDKDYDQIVNTYQSLVKTGALTSSAVNADGQTGTRLDGSFTKNIKGSAVIFKIRDKTVTVQTDADTFKGDFDALIKTITFNK